MRATFTKIESRRTKIEEMDTRINLLEIPPDENCILMCVHKDEREKSSFLLVCLFLLPSISRCNQRGFRPEIFLDGSHWCLRLPKKIRLVGECSSVVQLYIYFPFFCFELEETISSTSWLPSYTWLTYAKNIIPRCLTTSCSAGSLRFDSQRSWNKV